MRTLFLALHDYYIMTIEYEIPCKYRLIDFTDNCLVVCANLSFLYNYGTMMNTKGES